MWSARFWYILKGELISSNGRQKAGVEDTTDVLAQGQGCCRISNPHSFSKHPEHLLCPRDREERGRLGSGWVSGQERCHAGSKMGLAGSPK